MGLHKTLVGGPALVLDLVLERFNLAGVSLVFRGERVAQELLLSFDLFELALEAESLGALVDEEDFELLEISTGAEFLLFSLEVL